MHHSTIEDLLISYYDGKATADEIQEIEAWIKLSDENKKKAMDIYTLLLMTDTQQITEKMDMNEELSKVKGRMLGPGPHWRGFFPPVRVRSGVRPLFFIVLNPKDLPNRGCLPLRRPGVTASPRGPPDNRSHPAP